MLNKDIKLPYYAKASLFFVGLYAFFSILYIAQNIIIPVVFAIIISIILNPVVNFFINKKINRVVAITITLFIAIIFLILFGSFLIWQLSRFSEAIPALADKLTAMLNEAIIWASGYFNIDVQRMHEWVEKSEKEILNVNALVIAQILLSVGSVLILMFLVPVYTFIILHYKYIILEFIRRLFCESNQSQVTEVIIQTKSLIQHYIIGLLVEALIIATLYTVGLQIIGIQYAVLLGLIAAMLNIIPYIGGLIALTLMLIVTIATKDSITYPLLVAALSAFIHLLDNSFILPKVVGSKVKINALFCIMAVISGHALWGVPGMFLSIPVLAIVKLILDHIKPLKPLGFLLGNAMPPLLIIK